MNASVTDASPLGATPSHRCKVCGALWRLWEAAQPSWQCLSEKMGACCDNVAMSEQLEQLEALPREQPKGRVNALRRECSPPPQGWRARLRDWWARVLDAVSTDPDADWRDGYG